MTWVHEHWELEYIAWAEATIHATVSFLFICHSTTLNIVLTHPLQDDPLSQEHHR